MPITVSWSVFSGNSRRMPRWISPHGLGSNGFRTTGGGTLGIPRLASVPAIAMPIRMRPIHPIRSFHAANITLPIEVPRMIARKVLISSSPFARERSLSGSISGRIPYLAGLKNVAWSAIRNRMQSIHPIRPERNAKNARTIAAISKALVTIRTLRLLQASAIWPA